MIQCNSKSLEWTLWKLRERLEKVWGPDTGREGTWDALCPSRGQCASTAVLLQGMMGGEIVTASVQGQTHWFLRSQGYDIDLTGDQFGGRKVAIGGRGVLYRGTRPRRRNGMGPLHPGVGPKLQARANLLARRLEEEVAHHG